MKQQQFPLFEEWEQQEQWYGQLLHTIDTAPLPILWSMLTEVGITSPKDEKQHWNQSYGYREEGNLYHWITFEQFVNERRASFREIVIRVRDGKAKNIHDAKEQIVEEGRKNIRTLTDQLRSKFKKKKERLID